MKFIVMSLLFCLLLMGCENDNPEIIDLELVKALPIEYEEAVEPSGLTSYNGDFYTVSDDHDNHIFRLGLLDDRAVLHPHLEFQAPPLEGIGKFDFEGITCDADGNFYLVSETATRILRVSQDGDEVDWIFESLKPYGQEAGLFRVRNGMLEGIALLDSNQFVLCAERQSRGLIMLNLTKNPAGVEVFNLDKTSVELPQPRFMDFTGLCADDGGIYVLERAASLISKLVFEADSVRAVPRWSYVHIENSDEYRYADTLFTKGEGLYIDGDFVYVILDNNRDARYSDPQDRRPLLFIMERPRK